MREALTEAALAQERGDLAVGAVVVLDGEIVGRGGNMVTSTSDPFAHAEVVALKDFATRHPGRALDDGFLVTTFEPCPMCLGACLVLRVGTVVVGGQRRPDERAWGRYRPQDLASITAVPGRELRVLAGPLGDECVRLRNGNESTLTSGSTN